MDKQIRSIRISDDIWQELYRLRRPVTGMGTHKEWDSLFNYFLILHHGNGDWRKKVQEVDLKMNAEFNRALEKMLLEDKEDVDISKINDLHKLIERKYYSKFTAQQSKDLNKPKT